MVGVPNFATSAGNEHMKYPGISRRSVLAGAGAAIAGAAFSTRVMADAHAKVVPTTICDDADIHAWQPGNDITVRLIRSLVSACKTVPALNAWFDGDSLTRTLHPHVDIGIAVDTEDGLFVPALRNADMLDGNGVRAAFSTIARKL